jgi:hypothetical protein
VADVQQRLIFRAQAFIKVRALPAKPLPRVHACDACTSFDLLCCWPLVQTPA